MSNAKLRSVRDFIPIVKTYIPSESVLEKRRFKGRGVNLTNGMGPVINEKRRVDKAIQKQYGFTSRQWKKEEKLRKRKIES